MDIIFLKLGEFEKITDQTVFFSVFDKSGKKIYAAEVNPAQLLLLDIKKGGIVSFSMGSTVGKRVDYEVSESDTVLVRTARFHQIHVQLIVEPKGDAKSEDITIMSSRKPFSGPSND